MPFFKKKDSQIAAFQSETPQLIVVFDGKEYYSVPDKWLVFEDDKPTQMTHQEFVAKYDPVDFRGEYAIKQMEKRL